jgi:squalene-associated FAD-dependent desaturase
MAKCLVIGGGLAGLSASVFLNKAGYKVTLIEASPKLGGRAYSFNWNNLVIDNGQHLMMGCYKNTIDFLRITGGFDKVSFGKSLKMLFVQYGGRISELNAPSQLYPLNLAWAMLRFQAFNLSDRLRILYLFLKLPTLKAADFRYVNIEQWLKKMSQPAKVINTFWNLLAVSMLNTDIDSASAGVFINVLKTLFLGGRNNSTILLPQGGLSEIFADKAEEYLLKSHCEIKKSEKIIDLIADKEKIKKIITNRQEYNDFDFIVSAIPINSIMKILPPEIVAENIITDLKYSPIVNVHIKLNENPFSEEYYGLLDSKIHWVFNKGSHINIVISGAENLLEMDNKLIMELVCTELENHFPCFYEKQIDDFIVIKEKKATFMSTDSNLDIRKKIKPVWKNLIFAGDWINTGLPSTIESAITSGKQALELIKKIS